MAKTNKTQNIYWQKERYLGESCFQDNQFICVLYCASLLSQSVYTVCMVCVVCVIFAHMHFMLIHWIVLSSVSSCLQRHCLSGTLSHLTAPAIYGWNDKTSWCCHHWCGDLATSHVQVQDLLFLLALAWSSDGGVDSVMAFATTV